MIKDAEIIKAKFEGFVVQSHTHIEAEKEFSYLGYVGKLLTQYIRDIFTRRQAMKNARMVQLVRMLIEAQRYIDENIDKIELLNRENDLKS